MTIDVLIFYIADCKMSDLGESSHCEVSLSGTPFPNQNNCYKVPS